MVPIACHLWLLAAPNVKLIHVLLRLVGVALLMTVATSLSMLSSWMGELPNLYDFFLLARFIFEITGAIIKRVLLLGCFVSKTQLELLMQS